MIQYDPIPDLCDLSKGDTQCPARDAIGMCCARKAGHDGPHINTYGYAMGVVVENPPQNRWRDEPPRTGEWDAPDIVGWAFRGQLRDPTGQDGVVDSSLDLETFPVKTTERGILLELLIKGDDGLPIWARFRSWLFHFNGMRGQWCPIRVKS